MGIVNVRYGGREPQEPPYSIGLRFSTTVSGMVVAERVEAIASHVERDATVEPLPQISMQGWREGIVVPALFRIATTNPLRDVVVGPLDFEHAGFMAADEYDGVRVVSYVPVSETSSMRQARSSERSSARRNEERAIRRTAVAAVALYLSTECHDLGVAVEYDENSGDEPGE